MPADDAQIRAWAQDNGVPVSVKGRVAQATRDAYTAAHNGGETGPDYPDGMTDADFETAAAIEPDLADFPDEVAPRPVGPKASSVSIPKSLSGRLRRGKTSAGPKPKQRKPKQPRVSTADLIGSAWRIGAKLAQPIPPMYRTLRLQSVIAGPLCDDAVKGTVVDPFLQPLARLSRAGETVSALVAPNVAIGVMAWHAQHAAQQGQDPNPVIMQAAAEMFRHGLMAMMRIGGDAFAAQLAAEQADEERFGGSVETIMAWIMSEPADPATEEANIARVAAMFAGQTPEPAPDAETTAA
jgi:hypothetical protein